MPLPTTVSVSGTFLKGDGSPEAGYLDFTNSIHLVSTVDDLILSPMSFRAELDGSGHFSQVLPATDDADWSPVNWTWQVSQHLSSGGVREYSIYLLSSVPDINVADLIPQDPSPGAPSTVIGPSGGITSVNGDTGPAVVIDYADVGAAPTVHLHSGADVTTGTVATARLNVGTSSGQVAAGDHSHGGGGGGVTSVNGDTGPAVVLDATDVGAATSTHDHDTAYVQVNPASTQVIPGSAVTTWAESTAPYSAGDNNVDQQQWFAYLSGGISRVKTFWRNGNNEVRFSPSLQNRIAARVFEMSEGAGLGASTGDFFQVSTNPTVAASREPLLATRGSAHSTEPGWTVSTRTIRANALTSDTSVNVTGDNSMSVLKFRGRKTSAGAPGSGTWVVGDVVIDSNGMWHECTVAGTPGTWVSHNHDTSYAALSHTHNPADITGSGNLAFTGNATITGNLTVTGIGQKQFVRKTADESVTSSTTLQDDNHLLLSVVANAVYIVRMFVIADGDTAGDIKLGFTAPASATFDWAPVSLTTTTASGAAALRMGANVLADTDATGLAGAGTKTVSMPHGLLVTAGTAGTFTFRWAQQTSSATATTVYTNSWMQLERVA